MASLHPAQNIQPDQEHGRLYRLIADTIPHMVWTARADGSLDYFNRRCHEYTGLDSAQLAGWAWKAVVHPEDWDGCLSIWKRSLQSGERYEIDYRLRRNDGVYRWHHGTAMPAYDSDGRLLRWLGTCTDVEEQFRSAHILESMVQERTLELRHAERRLQGIVDNEPECVKVLDRSGFLLDMNPAGLRMIEADGPEPLLGRCVYPLVAAEHRQAFRELTERVCRGERGKLEFEIVGLKGTRRWLETHAAPLTDAATGETRLLGITRDVTERRHMEQALRESEQRFQLFMEHMPARAWIRDADFRYLYANRALAQSYGTDAASMVGQLASEFEPGPTPSTFRERDAEVLKSRAPMQFTDHQPNGSWLKVKFPVPLPGGGLGVAGIAVDITERIQAEEKAQLYASRVREMVLRLIHAQEIERRRLADELHDLIGQNLTAMGLELGTLKSLLGAQAAPTAAERLDAVARLVGETIELIRGVMSELRPPALEEYGLLPALRWYAGVFSERTGMQVDVGGLQVDTRLDRDSELALFRIVQEALTNAWKHSGGTQVKVACTELDGKLRFTVEDNGNGFAEPKGARSAGRGGWGLPTMRERAQALGGVLHVEFPGRGTRLVVDLPRKHAD